MDELEDMASGLGSGVVCMLALTFVEFQLTSSSKDNISGALSAWLLSRMLAGSTCMLFTYVAAINAAKDANNNSPFMPSLQAKILKDVEDGNAEEET